MFWAVHIFQFFHRLRSYRLSGRGRLCGFKVKECYPKSGSGDQVGEVINRYMCPCIGYSWPWPMVVSRFFFDGKTLSGLRNDSKEPELHIVNCVNKIFGGVCTSVPVDSP